MFQKQDFFLFLKIQTDFQSEKKFFFTIFQKKKKNKVKRNETIVAIQKN